MTSGSAKGLPSMDLAIWTFGWFGCQAVGGGRLARVTATDITRRTIAGKKKPGGEPGLNVSC